MQEHERLKLIRKTLNHTQLEFSEVLEIKQGSYSDVERGKAGISSSLIKHLIRKFNVNPIWLIQGEGDMFIGDNQYPVRGKIEFTDEPQGNGPENYETDHLIAQLLLQQKSLSALEDIIDFVK